MYREKPSRVATIQEIMATNSTVIDGLKKNLKFHAALTGEIITQFLNQLHPQSKQQFSYTPEANDQLSDAFDSLRSILSPDDIELIIEQLESRRTMHNDWLQLGAFLAHDFYKLSLVEIVEILNTIEPLFITGSGKMTIHIDRTLRYEQVEQLQAAQTYRYQLLRQRIYPLEFIQTILELQLQENTHEILTEKINVLTFIHIIAQQIRLSYFEDEYEIVFGTNETQDERAAAKNRIILDIDPKLEIVANPAMLFGILYNLLKNAAKANNVVHIHTNNRAMHLAYETNEQLKHPLNLKVQAHQQGESVVISVIDEGRGMSLDLALDRFKEQLSHRLAKNSIHEIKESEWFKTIAKAAGVQQATLLTDWHTNPDALLDVLVRTIFVLQFVAGFSSDSWEIRSVSSGTGLWGVRYILELLEGSVHATNDYHGGAKFTITLPMNSHLQQQPSYLAHVL